MPDDARALVEDGAPCPLHGAPTRLLYLPGVGYLSQCAGCRDDFLAWFGSQQPAERAIPLHERPAPAQITLDL